MIDEFVFKECTAGQARTLILSRKIGKRQSRCQIYRSFDLLRKGKDVIMLTYFSRSFLFQLNVVRFATRS